MWVARLIVFLSFLTLQNRIVLAQNNNDLQDSLQVFFSDIKKAYDDPVKEEINRKIYTLLKDTLSQQNSFTIPFLGMEQFNKVYYAVYANVFADVGIPDG